MGVLTKESSASQTRNEGINVVPPTAEEADSPDFTASSLSSHPTSTESATASLLTPNIHINHVHVYNVTPEQFKRPEKFRSPAASSGPICRICHEGDAKEDLVSPCRCTGTVGLVHLSCMERWLSTRCNENDKCELCNYTFATIRYPKSVLEWIRSDENDESNRRSLIGDATCFFLLTPLAIVSSFLCVVGAKRQVLWGNSLEAGCLMALATFLITIYFVWNALTFRYHLKCYLMWRSSNHNVKLVRVQRLSTATEGRRNYSSPQDIQSARGVTSQSCIISIPVFDEVNGTNNSSNRPTYNSHPAEV